MLIRCPSCAKPTTPAVLCENCSCPAIDAENYGIARMLHAEGVAPHDLSRAVASTDPGKRNALQLRWAVMQRATAQLSEIVETLTNQITSPAVAKQLSDSIAASLPFSESTLENCNALFAMLAPLPQQALRLRWRVLVDNAPWPWLRQASEIALARTATTRQELPDYFHAFGDGSALDIEAALVQLEWRAVTLGVDVHARHSLELQHLIERAVHLEPWAARAAAVLVARTPDLLEQHRVTLQHGRLSEDVTTRIACALALPDEPLLELACGDSDPIAKRAAQVRLAKCGSLGIMRALLNGSVEEKLTMLRDIERNGGLTTQQLPLLLQGVSGMADREHQAVCRLFQRRKRSEYLEPDVARIAAYAATMGITDAVMLRQERLDLLCWAVGAPSDPQCRTDTSAITDLMTCVAQALRSITPVELRSLMFHDGLGQFLLLAEPSAPTTIDIFDRWIANTAMGAILMRRLLDLHDVRNRHTTDLRGLLHIIAMWERGTHRTAVVEHLGTATANHRHLPQRTVLVDWMWSRFCALPDERAELYQAFSGWREDILQLRNQMPRQQRPGGESAAAHLQLWGGLDLEQITTVLEEAEGMADDEDWLALTEASFRLIQQPLPRQQIMALVGVCKLGHHLFNQWRYGQAAAGLCTAVACFEQNGLQLAAEMKRDGMLDSDFKRMLGNLTELLALFAKCREEQAERQAEIDQRERQQREHAIQLETQQADIARQIAAAHDQARVQQQAVLAMQARMQADITAQIAAQQAAAHATTVDNRPTAIGRWAMPNPIEAIDFEAMFPTLPLINLVDYSRVLVRLSRGGNPVTVFPEHNLDPVSFATCSQQFSALFAARPELVQRFATLMAANWT